MSESAKNTKCHVQKSNIQIDGCDMDIEAHLTLYRILIEFVSEIEKALGKTLAKRQLHWSVGIYLEGMEKIPSLSIMVDLVEEAQLSKLTENTLSTERNRTFSTSISIAQSALITFDDKKGWKYKDKSWMITSLAISAVLKDLLTKKSE